MRRLAIIDHVVSAGGVERFLHGLVSGMLELPQIREWELIVLLRKYNSSGRNVEWPPHISAANLEIRYLRDEKLSRLFDRFALARRIWGIPGTAGPFRMFPTLIQKIGSLWMRGLAGDIRSWIENYCFRNGFDLVYFSYPYLMDCPNLQNPIVATPHDFNYKHHTTFDHRTRALIDLQTPHWLHRSRLLVVSSEFVASELRTFYPEVMDKVRVVRLGIPASNRTPTSDEVKAYATKAGLPQKFLLSTGWIAPHKNQKALFNAMYYLRQTGHGIPLIFAGPNSDHLKVGSDVEPGSYVAQCLEIARSLGLEYGIDFFSLGYVSDHELACLYRLATALVVPSLYEAGSFPVLEAVNAYCPVLCSEIPALVEQSHLLGDSLWLFDPFDPKAMARAILDLLSKQELANSTRRARELALNVYSWKKTAAGYLKVFDEALQRS
jgi:glycosyltransferase involved in cell wall biosynthesis